MIEISYLSETARDYSLELRKCLTLDDLRKFVDRYKEIAPDAYFRVIPMTEEDFKEYIKGLKKETAGRFSGEKWALKYGAIILPELLMRIELIAIKYKTPFGLAWIRAHEMGFIIQENNAFYWKDQK